jgi:hypothetical protein
MPAVHGPVFSYRKFDWKKIDSVCQGNIVQFLYKSVLSAIQNKFDRVRRGYIYMYDWALCAGIPIETITVSHIGHCRGRGQSYQKLRHRQTRSNSWCCVIHVFPTK